MKNMETIVKSYVQEAKEEILEFLEQETILFFAYALSCLSFLGMAAFGLAQVMNLPGVIAILMGLIALAPLWILWTVQGFEYAGRSHGSMYPNERALQLVNLLTGVWGIFFVTFVSVTLIYSLFGGPVLAAVIGIATLIGAVLMYIFAD